MRAWPIRLELIPVPLAWNDLQEYFYTPWTGCWSIECHLHTWVKRGNKICGVLPKNKKQCPDQVSNQSPVPGWEGGCSQKNGWGYAAPSQNPYPIYDQNLKFFLPYLWPKSENFPTLFYDLTKNLIPILWPDPKIAAKWLNQHPITKTAEKPYPLGPHIPM